MTKARDAQTGILPGQEPDGGRIFLFFYFFIKAIVSIYYGLSQYMFPLVLTI